MDLIVRIQLLSLVDIFLQSELVLLVVFFNCCWQNKDEKWIMFYVLRWMYHRVLTCNFYHKRRGKRIRNYFWDWSWDYWFLCWCLYEWQRWNHIQWSRKPCHSIMGGFHWLLDFDLAKNQADVNPEKTIFDVKRFIGRKYDLTIFTILK